MDKVGHLRGQTILKRTIVQGKHIYSGSFEGEMILRRTICEGNMNKVCHLREKQF